MEQLDSSIIFMAGINPISYLIPFFPPGARFIRLEGHFKFNNPGVETKFQEEIIEIIHNHSGPFYLLSRLNYFSDHKKLLEDLGLRVIRADSKGIKSEHESEGLRLWVVRKENPLTM